MVQAVIVAMAGTPIGRAYKNAFRHVHTATLGAHVVKAAVVRAGFRPGDFADVILGTAAPEGASGANLGRAATLEAELPVRVPCVTSR